MFTRSTSRFWRSTVFRQRPSKRTPASFGERVAKCLGFAVCLGIEPSKTLAKLVNHCVKKNLAGSADVCYFKRMSENEFPALFPRVEVSEIWGVGQEDR